MSVLEQRTAKDRASIELRCPAMQTMSYAATLHELPRRVLDHVLLWHAQMRLDGLTDVDAFNMADQALYAVGWSRWSCGEEYTELPELPPVLGALIWMPQEDGTWWTQLGFVAPEVRGTGLYSMLWESCVFRAREEGVKRIQGGTHVTNKRMQRLMEKLGRVPHSIIYDYEVERA